MSSTVTTTKSYWGRVWDAFKWVFLWFLLIIGSISLLWWNEWNSVKISAGLNEGQKNTIEWKINSLDPSLDWKLIHIIWKADTKEILNDTNFWIELNAIKLYREVEMYQWKEFQDTESKDNADGSVTTKTTYTYDKVWSDEKLNSSNYHESNHSNPRDWTYKSEYYIANKVNIWDIKLSSNFVDKIDNKQALHLDGNNVGINFQNSIQSNNMLYIGRDPTNPEIWDLRVKFYAVYPADISVIWQQKSQSLEPYLTKVGTNIELLEYWTKSIQEMYKKAQDDNKLQTWVLRWIWVILMYVGFTLIFNVLVVGSKIIPFLSNIFWVWSSLLAFVLTFSIWWTTIALAWIVARPYVWIIILWSIFFSIFILSKLKITKKQDFASWISQ